MIVDTEQKKILSRIVDRFLNLQCGTRKTLLRRTVGSQGGLPLLDALSSERLLREVGGHYLPTYRGIDAYSGDLSGLIRQSMTCVLQALRTLYTSSEINRFDFDDIVTATASACPTFDGKDVVPALILGEEMGFYTIEMVQPDQEGRCTVQAATVHESIFNFRSIDDDLVRMLENEQPAALGNPFLVVQPGHGSSSSASLGTGAVTATETTCDGWEVIRPIGRGGQSEVFLARSPHRYDEVQQLRARWHEAFKGRNPHAALDQLLATVRPEGPSDWGALKRFKLREGGADPQKRLEREIAVLRDGRPGLPRLLASNVEVQWMVTEYFAGGTLADSPGRYAGQPAVALQAFRGLVQTISESLHAYGDVHRDIKPANIFISDDGQLVPGDFGIVFLSASAERLTQTDERVGPRDYMPQWADVGERLEKVDTTIDVYMLGKLLWCMVSGKARLPREWHRRAEYDLEKLFPQADGAYLINKILDECLVEVPDRLYPASARELLKQVDAALSVLQSGGRIAKVGANLVIRCLVCGQGHYRPYAEPIVVSGCNSNMRIFFCDVCCHAQLFAAGHPEEAVKKGKVAL